MLRIHQERSSLKSYQGREREREREREKGRERGGREGERERGNEERGGSRIPRL